MKKLKLLFIFLVFSLFSFSNSVISPINFKADNQSSATPEDGELYFIRFFYTRPVNVYFDGLYILVNYDNNGKVLLNKQVKSYIKSTETFDDGNVDKWTIDISENDENKTRYDTIEIIIDNRMKDKMYQIVIPTKDKYGENYTSYRKFK